MYIRPYMYKAYNIYKTRNVWTIINRSKSSEINVIKSKSADLQIPNQLLHEYVWQNLHKWHDKTAVVCFETGKCYTFTQIYRKSRSLAAVLCQKFHLKIGDVVAVILPNVADFPIAFLGSVQAGLVVTTVNPFYTADEMATQLNDSGSKLIFTTPELASLVNKASLRRRVPIVLAETSFTDATPSSCIKLCELCDNNEISNLLHTSPDDVAILPYSSGTTGLPKGVQLTHRNVVSNLYQMSSPDFIVNTETSDNFQDVVPVFLPLFHIYGLVGIFLNFLAHGCKLVMVSHFVGSQFVKLLELHQPTLLFAVPPMIVTMLNNPKIKFEDLKSIRTIISAAAPLGVSAMEEFNDKCRGKISLLQMYGMTETSPLTLMQTPKLPRGSKIGGSGFLIPNTEAKIMSIDSGDGLGANISGELLVRGPQVMKGYHRNADATREAKMDDWLKTGDICHYDSNQHFFITGRLKELIKVKGFQVAPAELEDILKKHKLIKDAAVVGIPHSVQGEVPKAFVVLKQQTHVKPEHLKDFVASKVSSYKRLLGGVVILKEIPRNRAGKILRDKLRNM